MNEATEHPQSNVLSNSTDNIMKNDAESSSTTQKPEQITVKVQNETSNMRNMIDQTPDDKTDSSSKNATIMIKNKPQLHDHHYHHSVTIITAVSLILLTILIVSVVIIGLYVNRHKNLNAHLTSSRTYVFDHQN